MSSADHQDLKLDACQIVQAGNGGYIVLPLSRRDEVTPVPIAAFSTKAELSGWLVEHLY